MANRKGNNSPHSQIFLDLIEAKSNSFIKPNLIINFKQSEIKTNKGPQKERAMQSPAMTTSQSNSSASIAVSDDDSEKVVAIKQPKVLDPEQKRERELRSRLRIFFDTELEGQDMQLCFAEGKSEGVAKNKKGAKERDDLSFKKNVANKFILLMTKLPECQFIYDQFDLPVEDVPGAFATINFLAKCGADALHDFGMDNVDPNLFRRKLWATIRNRRTYKEKKLA